MKVKNLSFSYNQKSFIKDLNIEFKENQITTIIGSNGSGKSTLLMLLSRIYKPQTGFIEINQQDIQNYKTYFAYFFRLHIRSWNEEGSKPQP